ncbi:MAG: VWA domain-containing protein [Acidobacteriota bacterium]
MRVLLWFLIAAPIALAGAPPQSHKDVLRVPVWAVTKDPSQVQPIDLKALTGKVDGKPAAIVSAHGPGDDLAILLVLDLSDDMALADVAKDAAIAAVEALPPNATVALLRAQDGLHVLEDPTTDRGAIAQAIKGVAVAGKAGLLDTVEVAERVADTMLAKSAVRVAVVYITDSSVANYREDFTNPVINSSDSHDISRSFPEGLVREKISKVGANLALFQTPFFAVHIAYRSDRLNEAYQTGLLHLATLSGGSSAFCRSRAEIPDAISAMFRTVAGHYSIALRMPQKPPKAVQVQLECPGQVLTYRNRFVLQR